MVAGSRMLSPFLEKHAGAIGDYLLEIGPFFTPLLTPEGYPGKKIFYWENDQNALRWLEDAMRPSFPLYCNLRQIRRQQGLAELKGETLARFRKLRHAPATFDAVVVSQVFNYVDYRYLLIVLKQFLREGGLLFVNNVVGHGLPIFFSERRPRSLPETCKALRDAGYEILEKRVFDPPCRSVQRNKRLIAVARNQGGG
jgi:hypothetical protein